MNFHRDVFSSSFFSSSSSSFRRFHPLPPPHFRRSFYVRDVLCVSSFLTGAAKKLHLRRRHCRCLRRLDLRHHHRQRRRRCWRSETRLQLICMRSSTTAAAAAAGIDSFAIGRHCLHLFGRLTTSFRSGLGRSAVLVGGGCFCFVFARTSERGAKRKEAPRLGRFIGRLIGRKDDPLSRSCLFITNADDTVRQ